MKTIIEALKALRLRIVSVRFFNQQKKYGKNPFQKHYFDKIHNIKATELRFKQYYSTVEIGGGIDIMRIKQRLLVDLINEIDKEGFVTLETHDTEMPMRKRVTISLWVSLNAR